MRSPSRTRKARKAKPSPSRVALGCLVLAVDPGEKCGWCIYHRGAYVDSGKLHGYDAFAIGRVIDNAQFFARAAKLPLMLVLEKPPKGGAAFEGRSPAGPASVIGSRKLWQHEWRELGGKQRFTCSVYPVSWRSKVLGMTCGPLLERMERLRANELAGKDVYSADEAAALCIGKWASHAGEVGASLVTRRRASQQVESVQEGLCNR